MRMEVFSEGNDKVLITLVSQHPLLYDLNHDDYKNSRKKDKVWNEIAKELNKRSENCKKRWKNIKDTYYRQKRKTTFVNGTILIKNPRSKFGTYDRLLNFLQLLPNERITEINTEDSDSTQDNMSDRGSESFNLIHVQEHLSPTSEACPAEDVVDPLSEISSKPIQIFPKSNKKRPHKNNDEIVAFLNQREDSRQKILETISSRNVEDPELSTFSFYIKSVLQKLPSNLKINAKKEIFDVLLKYESLNVAAPVVQFQSPELSSSVAAQSPTNAYETHSYINHNTLSTSHHQKTSKIKVELEPEVFSIYLPCNLHS